MAESTPQHQPNEPVADLQTQLAMLKQENRELRSRLQSCQQAQANQQLNSSDLAWEHHLLEATAKAANALLTIAPFDAAVNTALQIN